jgi:hypothetical protein
MLANFRRKRRNGEKNLQRKRSIYRGKGGSFMKRLDMTVTIFPGDACPLRHYEGGVFYQNSRFIRGIGSSESTRFPEGLVLGNWAKTLHPRNVRDAKFMNKFVGHLWRGMFCFAPPVPRLWPFRRR